jgi:pimeloyl-ACP methyl ester carboxylesterase
MTAKIASTKSGNIEFTFNGSGPTILAMHGQSQDCNAIDGYDAFIKTGFSVLTPSRPGYGKTPASVGDSAEKAADAMVDLLDYLKIEKANVVAISGGGPTAIFLAANHPERVRKLVLVSALSKPWQDMTRYESVKKFYSGKSFPLMWSMLRVSSVVFPTMTARQTLSLFSTHDSGDFMKHISKPEIKTLLRLYKSKAYTAGPLIDLKSQPEAAVLNKIIVPTLVAHSKEDKSVDFESAEYSVKNIKSAELFVSPTWSHFPWFGPHSEEELERVISFLKS